MAGEKFKLNFVTNGEGILDIDEPVGFDYADFTLLQESGRYGRDVFFAGGKSEFTFYKKRNHYFDTLMYYYETYGWESEVKLIIEKDGNSDIIGDLDFLTATTDQLDYFKCVIIQDNNQIKIKRRKDVKVDLFSNKDLDDKDITPVSTQKTLVKSKPIKNFSKWALPSTYAKNFGAETRAAGPDGLTEVIAFSPVINTIKFGIDNTLSFIDDWQRDENGSSFKIIEAQNNLKNIKIDISNYDISLDTYTEDGGDGYMLMSVVVRYGAEYITSQSHTFYSVYLDDESPIYTNNNDYTFTIPFLNRGDSVWFVYNLLIRQTAVSFPGLINPLMAVAVILNSTNLDVSAESTSYNTVVPSVRLYDAVEKTVESISGLPIDFDYADVSGDMYDQRVVNGNLLRNITDKPFYLSFKGITEWLPEINADYQIKTDGTVYFGLYDNFYENVEIGAISDVSFDESNKTFNDKYAINKFIYGYNRFQSQKENEVDNTYDSVHGTSEWFLSNNFVENGKDVKISFVRDAFMISEQQRKSIDQNETVSTQDDDTVFILDTIPLTEDLTFTETDFLQHSFSLNTAYLNLLNDGSFSFELLGISVGEDFIIEVPDANAGTYTVIEVQKTRLVLDPQGGFGINSGFRGTKFTYTVSTNNVSYITRSEEGFGLIDNVTIKESYTNLRFSIKRNITTFWNQFLSTCNLFSKKNISNTFYKNNPDAITTYGGVQLSEGESFLPSSPILSPYRYEKTVVTNFETYIGIVNALRDQRGYIRLTDNKNFVVRVYPESMTYVNSSELGELTISGEVKYQSSLVDIVYDGSGFHTINGEIRTEKISYSYVGEIFSIFDDNKVLLYNPLFWNKISVNSAVPESKEQLIEWLDLLI